jgi:hypothetical protein
MQSKRCFKCLCVKPLEAFYKHAKMGDGHLNKCKECSKKDVTENRLKNIAYYRQFDKARASQPKRVLARYEYARSDAGKKSHKKALNNYRDRFPERYMAKNILSNAIRDKKIVKQECFICGNAKVEAHHPDYSRPLDVVWLCKKHHTEVHLMANEYQEAA